MTNLIIAWGSPEYIGQETFLQFTTDNMMGDNRTSMINDDVIAQLLYNGDRGGTPTLESQLQLTPSSIFTNPTITCGSLSTGTMTTISFYVLSKSLKLIICLYSISDYVHVVVYPQK